jgi:hypothetical protein
MVDEQSGRLSCLTIRGGLDLILCSFVKLHEWMCVLDACPGSSISS